MKHIATTLALSLLSHAGWSQPAGSSASPPAVPQLDLSAPLGSAQNPIRAFTPAGQQEFLMRLRCPEGDAPSFKRRGSLGAGAYGRVVDAYVLRCASGRETELILDMYHRHREMGEVPGFKTLPELPARVATGCPPRVPGVEPGLYVFHPLELEQPAFIDFRRIQLSHAELGGYVYVQAVLGSDGRVQAETLQFPNADLDERLKELARQHLLKLQVNPAQHRPGCAVPQKIEGGFQVQHKP